MPEQANPAARPRHFGLFVSDRPHRGLSRQRDEGVSLDGETLRWWPDGIEARAKLADIVSIRLWTSPGGFARATGNCEIVFRRFDRVVVTSGSAFGNSDQARDIDYADFVSALHRALPAEVRQSAEFITGAPHANSPVVRAIGYALIGVIILGMLVTMFYGKGLRAILLPGLIAGFMLWPIVNLLRQSGKNNTYHPDSIPANVLP